jgi:hypothetical protein
MLSLAPGWVSRRHAIKMISVREPRVRLGEPPLAIGVTRLAWPER